MPVSYYDGSKLKAFMECPRKYYWRYVKDLVLKKYAPAPLNFGTAIHQALYTWYDRESLGLSRKEAQEKAIKEFHEIWNERVDDAKRTHEKGEELLRGYFKEYPSERFEFISSPEQTFRINLKGHPYVGRFDGVIRWNDMLLVLDHKTSSRMGKHYYKQYRPDISLSGYITAVQVLEEEYCDGAMINVLYFTKTKMRYEREIINREQWELQRFIETAVRLIEDIERRDPEEISDWTIHSTACLRWGPCIYRDLCIAQDPTKLIPLMYRKDTWDPLEDPVKKAKEEEIEEVGINLNL